MMRRAVLEAELKRLSDEVARLSAEVDGLKNPPTPTPKTLTKNK